MAKLKLCCSCWRPALAVIRRVFIEFKFIVFGGSCCPSLLGRNEDVTLLQGSSIAGEWRTLRQCKDGIVEGLPHSLCIAISPVCRRAAVRRIHQAVLTPDSCTVVIFDWFRGSVKDMVPEPTILSRRNWTFDLVPWTRYILITLST